MSRRRLLRGGATALVLAVAAYFFGRSLADNWTAVREIDVRFDVGSVGAVLLFGAAVVVSGLLWGHMVSGIGKTRVSWADAIRVQCASWLLKYVPGQVGSVANKVLWAGQRGISRTIVVITFVYENVFLLLGSIVPTGVILLLSRAFTDADDSMRGTFVPVLLALVPLMLVTNRRAFRWGVNLVARRALKRDTPVEYFLSSGEALAYQLAFLLPRVVNAVGFILILTGFPDVPSAAYVPLAAAYVLAGAVG
ncbi:MAG: hypothetical protein HGA44_15780, partial [Cellulomonadaceae bacterium]|nr:hypothetical protein [Cellulomonadaceae bacterium]